MANPFLVDIDCGAGTLVHFTLSEEELREHRDPAIKSVAVRGKRIDLRSAAYEVVVRMVTRNVEKPVSVRDGDAIYVIPTYAIRWVRMTDPELTGAAKGSVGFTMRAKRDDEGPAQP